MHDRKPEGSRPRPGVWRAAFGLFWLAPLVGEFLLGNLPVTWLPLLLVLAPLYGGGAILIREAARRRGWGWPSMLLWALAYAVVEEAMVTQSLFNPNYLGLRLLDYGFVPTLGVGSWWTVFVLSIHVIWSIATPIALVEAWGGEQRRQPWLGPVGLVVVAVVFAAGVAALTHQQLTTDAFRASPGQLVVSGVIVAVLLAAGAWVGARGGRVAAVRPAAVSVSPGAPVPAPRRVLGGALFAGSLFLAVAVKHDVLAAWLDVGALLLGLGGAAWGLVVLSRREGWTPQHEVAVAGGLLLTYAWYGFVQVPSVGNVPPRVDLLGNIGFGLGAVLLLRLAWRRSAAV